MTALTNWFSFKRAVVLLAALAVTAALAASMASPTNQGTTLAQAVTPTPTPTPTPGICDRHAKVQAAILAKLSEVSACADVTETHLAGITGTLDLSDMGVSSLGSGEFAGLSGLTKLTLEHNKLTTLPETLFSGLTSLGTLKVTFNDLTTLPEDVFKGLTKLKQLDLYKNKITALPENVFDGLTNLSVLNILHNDVTEFPEEVFDGLENLTRLAVKGNKITTLPSGVFDGLINLEMLMLHSNLITELPSGVFDGLESLKWLFLGKNAITALPAELFDGLNRLFSLHVDENKIATLPDDTFKGADSLQAVALQGNTGAPFTLTAELETEGDNGVVVKVAEGAPFHVAVTLSADGGTLSSDTATVYAGRSKSGVISVTASDPNQPQVTVSVTSAEFLGACTTGEGQALGLQVSSGPSLALTTTGTAQTAVNNPAVCRPVIDGIGQHGRAGVGWVLRADTSDIVDSDGLANVSYNYQWVTNDGSTDTDIDDATNASYTLTSSEAGKAVKVRVTFTDDAGNEESLISDASDEVEAVGGL